MSIPTQPRIEPRTLLRHPAGWLALGLGSGLAPLAPGTVASALAVLLWIGFLALAAPAWPLQAAVFALALAPCIVASGWAARRLGRKDPGCIVADEFAGQWLVLLLTPPAWPWWLAAFVLFRIFDIGKPWPMRRLERLPGGLGIVADDLAAGVYAAALIVLAAWLWPPALSLP
ncbi:MAG: phosphatidylglycerophosphatase A [Xanthomonadales bacterium]|nr:phosphatidylglycerophosphatase A [Xanthomonadales bacterium]